MPGKWGQFRALGVDERRLLVVALVWLPMVQIGLRMVGYRRMRQLLSRLVPNTPALPEVGYRTESRTLENARRVGRMVNIAAGRRPLRATCLARSLLTWWLLRRWGIAGTVVFGVPVTGLAFAAHAWVEVAGVVVNDAPDVRERFGGLEAVTTPPAKSHYHP